MQPLPNDVAAAVLEAWRLADELPLWPRWTPANTPLVLHGPDRAYLIGHPAPPDGYEAAEPLGGRAVHAGGPLPQMTANTAMPIAGHLCALAYLPEGPLTDAAGYARLLLHECFHVYQAQAMPTVPGPNAQLMAQYPENDPVNNAMAIVENRLLAAAVSGDLAAPARFLTVRQARQQQLAAPLAEYEQRSEYLEGTPTYIECRAGWPLAALTERLHQANVGGKWAAVGRFYATGAAIALLLDRVLPDWHHRLARGEGTPQQLLAQAIREPLPPLDSVLAEAGYPAIHAAEQEREQERRSRVHRLLAELRTGPGIPVEVELPAQVGFTYDPTNMLVVTPGTRLHTRMYGCMTAQGARLQVERLCLEQQEPRRITLRLPEPPVITPTEIRGEGFALTGPAGTVTAPRLVDGTYRITL